MKVLALCGTEIHSWRSPMICWEIPDEDFKTFDRLKTAIKKGIEKNIKSSIQRRNFDDFIMCGENVVINRENIISEQDTTRLNDIVIIPARPMNRPIFRKRIEKQIREWKDRYETLENDFLSPKIEVQLADAGFINVYPNSRENIFTCTTCNIDQKLIDDFLPVVDQHALTNPRCPKLNFLNNNTAQVGGNISLWIRELSTIARRCIKLEAAWDNIKKHAKLPAADEETKNIELICVTCKKNQPIILRLPCFHLNLCGECHTLQMRHGNPTNCEICCTEIEMSCRIYN